MGEDDMSGLSPISPSTAAAPTQGLSPQIQTGSQNAAFNNIGGLSSFNQYYPTQFGQYTSNIAQNPFANVFQHGANQGAFLGGSGAQNIFGGAQQLQGGAGAVLNTAFDPQQALYNRTLQELTQQSQANYAGSGVGTSPYAAGLMDQNLQNFNTTWQAQQLQNQVAGLNAAAGAQGAASGMYQAAPSLAYQSAMQPYSAFLQRQTDPMNAYNQLLQYGQSGSTLSQQQIQDYMSLLGLQPALAGAQNQTASTMGNLQALQMAELQQGIKGVASLGGLLPNSWGSLGPASPAPNSYFSGTGF